MRDILDMFISDLSQNPRIVRLLSVVVAGRVEQCPLRSGRLVALASGSRLDFPREVSAYIRRGSSRPRRNEGLIHRPGASCGDLGGTGF